jgi:hypothetical protein
MRRRFLLQKTRRLVLPTSVLLLAAACASKTDGAATGGGTDGGNDIFAKINQKPGPPVTNPNPPQFLYKDVKEPYADNDTAACKAFTSDVFPAGYKSSIRSCMCDNCFAMQRQCDALQGCQEDTKCSMDIDCRNVNTCYLGPAVTPLDPTGKGCVAVVDKWGNAGVSSALQVQLSDCSTANSCRP